MYNEVLSSLAIKPSGLYLDGTFGRGGHARGLLEHLDDGGRLIVIDRDSSAIEEAHKLAKSYPEKMEVIHGDFASIMQHDLDVYKGQFSGIMLDLGVSSPQIDEAERGFSFAQDGPLDMRMNQQDPTDAASWLAVASEESIAKVLWELGEERFARRIARAIVSSREDSPITTTFQLVDLIIKATPRLDRNKHPATRTFQAIRCHINDEMGQVQTALQSVDALLAPGGRLCVMSFHSLEDRICKRWMKAKLCHDVPNKLPVKAVDLPESYRLITKKPIVANAGELAVNPRARSAKLRVIEKL